MVASFKVGQCVKVMSESGKRCTLIAPIKEIDLTNKTVKVENFLSKTLVVPFNRVQTL